MNSLPSPRDWSENPHRRFLQTALFVDDAALEPRGGTALEPGHVVRPPGMNIGMMTDDPPSPASPEDEDAAETPSEIDIDLTERIVEGFANCGVTCAVLAPRDLDDERKDQINRLARRTDVIVLDWNIRGGSDATTLGLICRIVRDDVGSGGRLRLIVIYTADDLEPIRQDLEEALNSELQPASVVVDDEGAIIAPHFRISLLQKPVNGGSDVAAAEVLIGQVFDDFDQVAAPGLMQQLSLTALSSVRDQAHRVLARFNSDLDPALLGHRSQTSHRDAIVFALALLGSELSSLVRTSDISSVMSEAMVADHVDRLLGGVDRQLWKGKGEITSVKLDQAREFLLTAGAGESANAIGVNKKKTRTVSSLMVDAAPANDFIARVQEVEHLFAILACTDRSSYSANEDAAVPALEYGVLLRDGADYLLCLQPVCDSVRIQGTTEFLFFPMVISDEAMDFDIVVWDDGPIALKVGGDSLGATRGISFPGDQASQVVLAKREESKRVFYTADGVGYDWVATIREAYVRRILTALVTSLTRVGLDESEFMQRKG